MARSKHKKVCDYSKCDVEMEISKSERLYCSDECRKLGQHEKRVRTCLQRYGVTNPGKSKKVRTKINETVLKVYGVPFILQSPEVRAKIKATNKERHGCEYGGASKEALEKKHQTNLERYGVDELFKSKQFQKKLRDSMVAKYGVANYAHLHMPKETVEKLNSKKWISEQIAIKTVSLIAEELSVDYKVVWCRIKKFKLEVELAKFKKELRLLKKHKLVASRCRMSIPNRRFCEIPECENMVTSVYGKYCSDACRSKGQAARSAKKSLDKNGVPIKTKPLTEEEKKLKGMVSLFPKPPKKS